MRVWDLPPVVLCRQHLLGEHNEIHAMWTILTQNRKGYSSHPEVIRWRGRLAALKGRHDRVADEMMRRCYKHRTPLDPALASGSATQTVLVESIESQINTLHNKGCACRLAYYQEALA